MEPTTGIEPVNLILTKDALYLLSYVGLLFIPWIVDLKKYSFKQNVRGGAGNGIRTRDPQLGRLTL